MGINNLVHRGVDLVRQTEKLVSENAFKGYCL